jgi:small subunit ribosomal protein S20
LFSTEILANTLSHSFWRPVLPNTKSAEKRVRTNEKRAQRNRQARSRLRTALKKVRQAESPEDASAAFRSATELLDRAASRRLIHPNKAARTKSRLAKLINERAGAASA